MNGTLRSGGFRSGFWSRGGGVRGGYVGSTASGAERLVSPVTRRGDVTTATPRLHYAVGGHTVAWRPRVLVCLQHDTPET